MAFTLKFNRFMSFVHVFLLTLLAVTKESVADVFKCQQPSGKIIYQPSPCPTTQKLKVIKVQPMSALEADQAKQKLKAWHDEQAANEALKIEEETQRKQALEREESLALQRRIAIAEEQRTILERQKLAFQTRNQPPIIFVDPYSRHHWDNPDLQQPYQHPVMNQSTQPTPLQKSTDAPNKAETSSKTKSISLR